MAETETDQMWLEHELAELRVREALYRQRLGQDEAFAARLRTYAQSLHQLFRRRPPSQRQLERTLADVARLSSQALGIRRTSVWRLDERASRLSCVLQLVDEVEIDAKGVVLDSSQCPAYVHALDTDHAVAVNDVYTDPRTMELTDYLREHCVGALLDIPIVVPGSLLGVVCHEHVGGPRHWHEREIDFASAVGQLIALALETERRLHAEYAANNTGAKYEYLVESLPVTVYSFDARTGELDYLSPNVEKFGGFSSEHWLKNGARAWVELVHPDDREPVLQRFRQGTTGNFPEEVSYRVLLPGGDTRWVRDTCNVVRDHAGKPLALQGILADVTEQTEAELSRIEFERRYRALLEHEDFIAVSLDREGLTTFVNDAFVRMSGYPREAILGRDWFELMLPPNDRSSARERFLSEIAEDRGARRFEISMLTKSGETRQLLSTNIVLRTPDGEIQGCASVALDVTERRKFEDALLQQTKLESLGQLAAGVAHDFNNLLTVLMAQVGLIERRCRRDSPLHEELASGFSAIDQALAQAGELTRSLLLYGRKQPARIESFTLDDLVRESLPLLEAIAGRALRIHTSLHADDVTLTHDRIRIRQVLVNLVGNAVDATHEHGARVRIATHVELVDEATAREKGLSHGGEFAVLTVEDDGKGMDPSTLARIFDPFFTTKADGRGTGLGLAITQTIVNQAGGFIVVESTPGKGTLFRVYLRGEQCQRVSRISLPAQASSTSSTRVLVVDDLGAVRDVVTATLHDAGYAVVAVPDTHGAAEVLAFEPVDLLITDEHLPDGSGTVLARSARSLRPELRTVLISGDGDSDASLDAVLPKPFDGEQLLAIVRSVLERA